MRVEIAKLCSEKYGMNLRLSDITDCDGCHLTAGRLFSGCAKCEIRKCAIERRLDSCAFCDEYACDRLETFFSSEPDARARLEALRTST